MSSITIDQAILEELLRTNVNLIVMALEDAAAWREEMEEDQAAEAYSNLREEIEGWLIEE